MPDPYVPDEVVPQDLDREARGRLRGLTKENADRVARHLVMAGRLLDDDPEAAYEHAQAAVRRAGRIDVVREAAALAAYATGRYAEALRELRTVRRLSGIDAHRALEADAERGLGRPERAIALFAQPQDDLQVADRIELTIVASGARLDLGQAEAALALLDDLEVPGRMPELAVRVREARVDVLVALGRTDEAEQERAALPPEEEEPFVVTDLEEVALDEGVLEEATDLDDVPEDEFSDDEDEFSDGEDDALDGGEDDALDGGEDDALDGDGEDDALLDRDEGDHLDPDEPENPAETTDETDEEPA